MPKAPTNKQIADMLDHIADLLDDDQETNPFRIRAYREGAATVRNHDQPVAAFVRNNKFDELTDLPNIGEGIAAVIGEYVSSGQSSLLNDLEAKVSPERVLNKVPGIGEELAERLVKELHIKNLPDLEQAAHDGRLEAMEGFGPRRVEGVRTALAGMLSRAAQSRQRERTASTNGKKSKPTDLPSVELVLEIDAMYRQQAKADKLHKIAPRRFNPKNEAWLPVLNIEREGWSFTVLFSNTAKAHELKKTDDWVVIYYKRDGKERQNTVVTETSGPLEGQRVVRGRKAETQQYYETPSGSRK